MKRHAARPSAATWTMLALVLVVGGCATVRPVVKPGLWDLHADSGSLKVFGAGPTSPGQQVFQALQRERSLEALLKREGQPDTLEVVGGRYERKQILLTYKRRGAGRPRRIVLDSTNDGFVARAPEPLATPAPGKRGRGSKQSRKKAQEPAAVREKKPTEASTPTAQQKLECPIDAARSDCQALCKGGATYEWCR
jgi:hypothetical protein